MSVEPVKGAVPDAALADQDGGVALAQVRALRALIGDGADWPPDKERVATILYPALWRYPDGSMFVDVAGSLHSVATSSAGCSCGPVRIDDED